MGYTGPNFTNDSTLVVLFLRPRHTTLAFISTRRKAPELNTTQKRHRRIHKTEEYRRPYTRRHVVNVSVATQPRRGERAEFGRTSIPISLRDNFRQMKTYALRTLQVDENYVGRGLSTQITVYRASIGFIIARLNFRPTYNVQSDTSTEEVTVVSFRSRQSMSTARITALYGDKRFISKHAAYADIKPEDIRLDVDCY
ncbi:glycerol-3-phosphate dehydrogenase [Moniliophthora roreri]|nr:glycerol-3-phosphate dehydrogenase [Moniliophthora roreri]